GLEAREAELQPAAIEHWTRKGEGARSTGLGQPGKLRTTRVRQPQELRGLVESFARRIIARLSQQPVTANGLHFDQHGVPAGDQQRDVRKGRRLRLKQRSKQVPLEVVHADRGYSPR